MALHLPIKRKVKPGGKLDVRFVVLVRGFGRQVGAEREVRLTLGSIALVRVGGYMTFSGYVFKLLIHVHDDQQRCWTCKPVAGRDD